MNKDVCGRHLIFFLFSPLCIVIIIYKHIFLGPAVLGIMLNSLSYSHLNTPGETQAFGGQR